MYLQSQVEILFVKSNGHKFRKGQMNNKRENRSVTEKAFVAYKFYKVSNAPLLKTKNYFCGLFVSIPVDTDATFNLLKFGTSCSYFWLRRLYQEFGSYPLKVKLCVLT